MKWLTISAVASLTPLDDAFQRDPYPALGELREQEAIHHDTHLQRFFFTKYENVKQILRNPDYWSDPHKAKPQSFARFLIANLEEGKR